MNAEHQAGEDLEARVAGGQAVGHAGPWRIRIGNSELLFRSITVADPILTGAQVIAAAGVSEPTEHLVFQMLRNGLLEEINPEEITDIRLGRVARFLVFRSDRTFRLLIDDRAFDWGASHISGATLRALANRDEPELSVWHDTQGQADRLVDDEELVALSIPGVERFHLRKTSFEILVNGERKVVFSNRLSYWKVVKLGFPDANPQANIVYTIDYAFGPSQNPEGSLGEHQSVKLKNGMKFYVTPTDKS